MGRRVLLSAAERAASSLLNLALCVFFFWGECCGAASAAGSTTLLGGGAVDNLGQFNYSIPISVPPGTNGIAPTLSLDYSNTNGDSLEGYGWALNGLAAITRCPKTMMLNNARGGVNYDANDRFCFGGQQLMITSTGTYGDPDTTYDTQTASFILVKAHGTAGTGPSWFEVHLRSGTVLELGNTTDSKIIAVGNAAGTVREWLVDKVTDVNGNYMTVTYNNDTVNGQAYPLRIDYTGNTVAGTSTYSSVRFTYQSTPRGDIVPTYEGGSLQQFTTLLTDIVTYNGSSAILDYKLAYRQGTSTLHSRLTSVTECDGVGTHCLAPTSFNWQGGTGLPTLSATSDATAQGFSLMAGRFAADGQTKAVVLNPTCPSSGGLIYDYSSGTDSFSPANMTSHYTYWKLPHTQVDYSGPACLAGLTPYVGDFDGDGYADVMGKATYWFLQGGVWESRNFATVLKNNKSGALNQVNMDTMQVPLGNTGDYDGDGRTDGYNQASSTVGNYYASQGDGTFIKSSNITGTGTAQSLTTGDFDGDGCGDLLTQGTSNAIVFFCRSPTTSVSAPSFAGSTVVTGDFNGDGKTDLLVVGSSGASLYLATGVGLTSAYAVSSSSSWSNYTIVAGDWNGDGKADVVLLSQTSANPHLIMLSTGKDFSQATTVANTNVGSGAVTGVAADWNSDGADDLWIKQSSDVREMFAYQPELIASVSNGIGATTSITYDRLNKNGSFYTRGTASTYPVADLDGPYYAVSQLAVSNGHTSFHIDYVYNGAQNDVTQPPVARPKSNISTAGILGFTAITSTDSRTGLVTTSNYRTDPGFIGLLSNRTVMSGTTTVSTVVTAYNGHFLFNDPTVVSRQSQYVFRTDLDGTAFPQIRTSYGYDGYNNPTAIVRSAYDGTTLLGTTTTTNTFNNYVTDPDHRIIGVLTESDVEAVMGSSDITRHTSFTPDAPTGHITQSIVEPGNADLQLQSDYGYDTFGNLHSVQQSGQDITTRTNTLSYETTRGQFPQTFSNALTQNTGMTFDQRFGGETSVTDPNSVTIGMDYDTLGRPATRTNRDGTHIVTAYDFCSGVNGGSATCPSTGAYVVTTKPTDTSGAQDGTSVLTYYDALDRVIATDTQGFDGSTIRVASSYDDPTGRLSTTSRPYFLSGGTPKNTLYSYDVLNRLTLVTFPDTSETSYCYHGLITSTTNDKGQTKTVAKNYQGLPVSIIDNASAACSTTGGVATAYTYDAFGDPLTVTEPGSHAITNVFDIRGRKTSSTDPDMGHWTYAYDQLGELLTQTDANSHSATLTYDTLQRSTTRTESGFFSKWLYDTTNGIGYLQNACVNATCASGNYQQKPTYDGLSRIATGKLILDGTTYTYTPSYDSTTGRLTTLSYPSGFVARYIYNGQGYLSQIQDDATGAALWTANTADAELHLTQQTAGNSVTTNESFDSATGNLTTICASTGPVSCTVANFIYSWDTIGNLTQRQDPTRYTESFCYDGLNRVTNYALGSSCTGSGTTTVAYDGSGNITQKTDICATANCFQYGSGAGPHALTSIVGSYNGVTNPTFAYDANGNMTSGGGRTITPTSFNMAASIAQGSTSVGLAYGAWHSRYKMCAPDCTAPTSTTYYLTDPATGGMSEKLVTSSTTTWKDYIVAPGAGLVAVRSKTGSTVSLRYIVTDHLGSITSVSDTSTPITTEHDSYDAWGLRRNANGTGASCSITSQLTRGYTSQEMLDSLCLINMNARIQDPQLGRFISADSIVPDPGYGQSYNRYSYVVNNPLAFTDPSGNVNVCEDNPKLCEIVTVWADRIYPAFGDSSYFSESPQGLQNRDTNGIGNISPLRPTPEEPSDDDDDNERERKKDFNTCRQFTGALASACYESALKRDWARRNGRPLPPLITSLNVAHSPGLSRGESALLGLGALGVAACAIAEPCGAGAAALLGITEFSLWAIQ